MEHHYTNSFILCQNSSIKKLLDDYRLQLTKRWSGASAGSKDRLKFGMQIGSVEKSVQKMEENGVVVPTWGESNVRRKVSLLSDKHDNGDSYYYDNGEYKLSSVIKKQIFFNN